MRPIHACYLVVLYDHLRNKPEVIRKSFEMAGIMKAITKELEPEDPFEDLVADHCATLSSKVLSFFYKEALVESVIASDYDLMMPTGRSDIHCRIKESLLIMDLKPCLKENVASKKLFLYYPFVYIFQQNLIGLYIISFSQLP